MLTLRDQMTNSMNNKLNNNPHGRAHGPPTAKTSYASTTNKLSSQVEEDVAMQNFLSSLTKSSSFNIKNLIVRPRSLSKAGARLLVEPKPVAKPNCRKKLRMLWKDSNRDPVHSTNITKLKVHRFPSLLMASPA